MQRCFSLCPRLHYKHGHARAIRRCHGAGLGNQNPGRIRAQCAFRNSAPRRRVARGDFALTEPYVSLSAHTALTVQLLVSMIGDSSDRRSLRHPLPWYRVGQCGSWFEPSARDNEALDPIALLNVASSSSSPCDAVHPILDCDEPCPSYRQSRTAVLFSLLIPWSVELFPLPSHSRGWLFLVFHLYLALIGVLTFSLVFGLCWLGKSPRGFKSCHQARYHHQPLRRWSHVVHWIASDQRELRRRRLV
jgi:hypothetical protein